MRFIFFAPAVFLFYAGMCAYIGARLFAFISHFFPAMKAIAFWIPFALLCCAFVFLNFFRHNLHFLRQAGLYWLAIFVYLLLLFAISDIVRLSLFLAGKKFPAFNFYAVGASLVLCLFLLVYGSLHIRSIHTVKYNVSLRGTGSDIRIALVSDLHIGATVGDSWIGRVVDTINRQEPDMVCIAGDIFDGNLNIIRDLPAVVSELKRINAPLGVYACLGNHDVDRMFNGGTDRIAEILKEANITLLRDEFFTVRDNLHLAGRRDARPIGMNGARKTAAELLADLSGTVVVLDHQPMQFAQLQDAGAALVLSGHTHAGQLFPMNLATRAIFKKAGAVHYGHWQGQTMQGVVTSGAGFWGPPVRIATNSEVAVIDVSFD